MPKTSLKTTEQTNFTPKSKQAATAKRPARFSRRSSQESLAQTVVAASRPARQTTKRGQLAALLVRDEGATVDQMIAATGWLPHTTRAALSGLRKAGYAIDSDKIGGIRTYRAVAPK